MHVKIYMSLKLYRHFIELRMTFAIFYIYVDYLSFMNVKTTII